MSFQVAARCLATICVLITLAWSRELFTLVGHRGLIGPDLASRIAGEMPLSLYRVVPPHSTQIDLALLLLSNLVAVLGVVVFWRPRSAWASIGLYVAFVCFKHTVALFAYGVYEFLQLGLFYVAAGNVGAYAFRRDAYEEWRAERLVGWFFRGHIAMAYLFSGLCKGVGPHWWTGESMWRALGRSDSTGQRWFNFDWLGQFPLVLQLMGISVVLMETLYPLAFLKRLRYLIVPGMIAMHLGTIVTQGLTLFGLTMISLNVFFLLEAWEWEQRRVEPKASSAEVEASVEHKALSV